MSGTACPNCGTANPEGARFCMGCGGPLAAACPSCGHENPPGAKFCTECGASLGGGEPAAPARAAADESPPEERRKATVLFADLSGYTAVSEGLDPERVKSLVNRALRRLADEVEHFGGTIDKFIGDNVMGVFGAPVAHEDDPERAVRAALAMQAAMAEINERVEADVGASFQLRVGVNSGEVLAGKVGDGYTVIGDPVNVASRLQSAAKPGTVIVGEITHRLTRAAIEYVELEPLTLKGKAEPVPAWEAVRAVVRGRAQRTSRDSSPLIGREDETALMLSLFERVSAESRPHLVTVIAEAGVGKSRMLRELAARAGALDPRPAVRIGGCPAYGAGLAYWALGEIVRGSFDIVDSDDAETAWRKLESGIAELAEGVETGEAPERLAEIVGRAVGIERPNGGSPAPADGEDASQIRDRLFAAVRVLVEASSQRQPLILAIEDIHWADEGMLDLIEYLARSGQGRVLIVCLARDELLDRRPGWGGGKMNATTIALEPLAEEDARDLVLALMPGETRVEGVALQVAKRSGGNPLFAEEIVNRLVEEGGRDTESLPDTVHALLAARLDALSRPERRALQHASVVGERFWAGSLAGVARDERLDLAETLSEARGQGPDRLDRGQPAERRARVRLQARARPRRRLLDAAEGGPRPRPRRGRRLHLRARRRPLRRA